MMPHRVALYWAPETDDPLHPRGSAWLGRDAEMGAALAQPVVPGIDLAEVTADPRRYGLHATLKPPFRLLRDYAALMADATAFAARVAPFDLPPLAVHDLDGFLALRETAPCPALHALADGCVAALDAHRAPPDAAELARRRPERLGPAQRANLDRWGYPHLFGEWRFHVTLTRRLAADEKAVVLPAVTEFLGDVPGRRRRVAALSVFVQPAPGVPFTIAARLPLRG
jgi:putative phosphonate metabolism protein